MSKKWINIIIGISSVLMMLGVIMAYFKVDTIIWMPFVLLSMILIKVMIYKLKKDS